MTLFDDLEPEPTGPETKRAAPTAPAPGHDAPLAERMRPRTLDDVVGQDKVAGPDGFLRRAVLTDRIPSLIFWGPPGSGKTTLARIIAGQTGRRFVPFSAVTSGIKEIKQVMSDAERLRRAGNPAPLLFVDEIHRFNRAQQDAFLPYVEAGHVVLVGATTENPSFELNGALLSRCRVVVLDPLDTDHLVALLQRALADSERGLGDRTVTLSDGAFSQIAQLASGDARRALNLLEQLVSDATARQVSSVDQAAVVELAQRKVLLYDKSGEEHFNLISALHKSLRESDPDAAVYWLVRMLDSGEEPLYVARRMVRFASEDIGTADPQALPQALAAWDAFHRLGSPEGDLALAQCAIYLALAPKSIATYRAWKEARVAVRERPAEPVPMAIRNAPTELMKNVGYGRGHRYAPETETGVGGMECLPDALCGTQFFRPADKGFERQLKKRLEIVAERRRQARLDRDP